MNTFKRDLLKNFRNVATMALICIAAFSTILYTSCKKNNCGSTSCINGGVCQSDTCECPTGYKGTDCGTTWASDLLGTYSCTSTCASGTYTSHVIPNSTNGQDTIVIQNFANYGTNVIAGVDANDKFYIRSGLGVAGTGTIANGIITVKYTLVTSGQACTLTMNKQ